MLFNFNLKSSLLLVFFIHGLVFSILLLIKAKESEAKAPLWLSAFIFLCTLYITPFMLGYAGWYGRLPYRDILFYLPFQHLLLMPPVLFFYIRSLLDRSFVFSKKQAWHFIPAGVYLAYILVIATADNLLLAKPYFYADGRDKDFSPWYQAAGFASLFIYLVLSLKLYRQYRRMTYELTSFAESAAFRWVSHFILALLVLLLLRGAFFISNPEWAAFGRKFWYYLCFSILFYYISVSGYLNLVQTSISLKPQFEPQPPAAMPEQQPGFETTEATADHDAEPDGIENLAELKTKLEALMADEKLFEDPTLTLLAVATRLNLPAKKVSQLINQGFGTNFNDMVNRYRVHEVIRKLALGEHSLQTLLAIAFECGFNSKSTFNRAFKKHTLLTPREYLRKYVDK